VWVFSLNSIAYAGQLRYSGWRQTCNVRKILSPSYNVPLLAIINPLCSVVSPPYLSYFFTYVRRLVCMCVRAAVCWNCYGRRHFQRPSETRTMNRSASFFRWNIITVPLHQLGQNIWDRLRSFLALPSCRLFPFLALGWDLLSIRCWQKRRPGETRSLAVTERPCDCCVGRSDQMQLADNIMQRLQVCLQPLWRNLPAKIVISIN